MLGSFVRIGGQPLVAILAGLAIGGIALAQDTPSITAPLPPSAVPAPGTAVPLPMPAPRLSAARLDQLVAPIALYPDPLLAQILMASTYPLEVVEAARWIADPPNRALAGEAMVKALAAQDWDASVKALTAFPDVLQMMSGQLKWTEDLGNAFLAQQSGVMDAVQGLRRQAMAAGSLKTTPQCDCKVADDRGTVTIEPAEPEDVRVPVYTPSAYGAWPYPDYPPDEFPSPDQYACPPGYWLLCYGEPVDLAFFGPLWGWGWIVWPQRVIVVHPHRLPRMDDERAERVWVHDPAHRGDVRYPDAATRARFDTARMIAMTIAARADPSADVTIARPVEAGRLPSDEAGRAATRQALAVTVLRGVPAAFDRVAAFRRGGMPTGRAAASAFRVGVGLPIHAAWPVAIRAMPASHQAVSDRSGGAPGGRTR